MTIIDTITEQINNNKIVLYIKGTKTMPACGFSAKAIQMLKQSGAEEFLTVDVLASDELRQAIKEYSSWPTIPQLYINQQFIGGCDIMSELYQSGELQKLLA